MYNNILLIIIFTILSFRVGWKSKFKYYHCKNDICYCCFEKSSTNLINYNDNTRQLHYVQGRSDQITKYVHTTVSKIKIMFNGTVTIYECPYGLASVYYSPNFYPLTRNLIQFVSLRKHVTDKVINVDKTFQTCLLSYCEFETPKNNMLICETNLIRFLNFQFTTVITSRCVQNITFVRIQSMSNAALQMSNFFDYAINVIFMQLSVTEDEEGTFRCSNFARMKKLRLLDISTLTLRNIKCIFLFNPDVIRITNRDQTVWNMCQNHLEVYDIKTVHVHLYEDDKPQLETTTETIAENAHSGLNYNLIILISCIFLITISALFYFIRRHFWSSVIVTMPSVTNEEIIETYV